MKTEFYSNLIVAVVLDRFHWSTTKKLGSILWPDVSRSSESYISRCVQQVSRAARYRTCSGMRTPITATLAQRSTQLGLRGDRVKYTLNFFLLCSSTWHPALWLFRLYRSLKTTRPAIHPSSSTFGVLAYINHIQASKISHKPLIFAWVSNFQPNRWHRTAVERRWLYNFLRATYKNRIKKPSGYVALPINRNPRSTIKYSYSSMVGTLEAEFRFPPLGINITS